MTCRSARRYLQAVLFISFAWLTTASVSAAESTPAPRYVVWVKDALVKVLERQAKLDADPSEIVLDVARGEYEAAQICVRPLDNAIAHLRVEIGPLKSTTGDHSLAAPQVRYVDCVPIRINTGNTPPEQLVAIAPAFIPDPLYEVSDVDVLREHTRSVWLTFRIPIDASPGKYTGQAIVVANEARIPVAVTVRVHRAVVPNPGTFRLTEWIKLDNFSRWGGCEMFSERFWEVVRFTAENMARHRQNMIFTPLSTFYTDEKLVEITPQGDRLAFDFARFDRWVEIFKAAGVVGWIEGGPIGFAGKVHCWLPRDGTLVHMFPPADSPEATEYLSQFFGALQAHLDEKGWSDVYYQHLMDEPKDEWKDLYNAAMRLARKHAPRIHFIEAVLSQQVDPPDIVVPILRGFGDNYDYYCKLRKEGKQAWFYTCCGPTGTYANRFIDYPLIKIRYIHWLDFKYHAPGYLHWGYNWWDTLSPFTQTAITYTTRGPYPPGDNSIVYPGMDGRPIDSIRWETVRDGVEDYELLKQLEAKDPARARRLCDSLIHDFDDYDLDVRHFRAAHKELLEALDSP